MAFAPGEIGTREDPTAGTVQSIGNAELVDRARADASTAPLAFFLFFVCAFAWLLVASAAGLTASIRLHEPD